MRTKAAQDRGGYSQNTHSQWIILTGRPMQALTCIYRHAQMYAHIYTSRCTIHIDTHKHIYMQTHMHTYKHIVAHTFSETHKAYTYMYITHNAYMHIGIRTLMHTPSYTKTCIHTHMHKGTHT